MTEKIFNQQFDQERALYSLNNAEVDSCTFAGPADGESALKETRNISVKNCNFSLRYPLWHVKKFTVDNSKMNDLTRAALWYCQDGKIFNSTLGGIKALRECNNIELKDCDINSREFGWKSSKISLIDSKIESEYLFLDSKKIHLKNVKMKGKYSFQYVNQMLIEDSYLDTKDAFWHTKNVTVKNSVIKGEYLAWYSEGLTLINCTIIGTQPLCYCKNLKLINCTMIGCDLSFEYSDVNATINGHVDSIKNPKSGTIKVDSVGEIIDDSTVLNCKAKIFASQIEKF